MTSTINNYPRITIVTPSYNQGMFIEETIRSVLFQEYPNLEYIIADGDSTDESIDIIKKYEENLAYWVSEKDNGQADALNKGFSKATGSLLGWLNSDDVLLPGSLHLLGQAHTEHPDDILAGDVENFDKTGRLSVVRQKGLTAMNYATSWNQVWEQKISYHQPGIFFPKKAWDICGPLDTGFRYCFDSDLMHRLVKHFNVFYLKKTIAAFRLHGSSKTVAEGNRFEAESDRVIRKYWKLNDSSPNLKSYSAAMGGKGAICWKHGDIIKGNRIAIRGFRLYPLFTIFGFLKALMIGIIGFAMKRKR